MQSVSSDPTMAEVHSVDSAGCCSLAVFQHGIRSACLKNVDMCGPLWTLRFPVVGSCQSEVLALSSFSWQCCAVRTSLTSSLLQLQSGTDRHSPQPQHYWQQLCDQIAPAARPTGGRGYQVCKCKQMQLCARGLSSPNPQSALQKLVSSASVCAELRSSSLPLSRAQATKARYPRSRTQTTIILWVPGHCCLAEHFRSTPAGKRLRRMLPACGA